MKRFVYAIFDSAVSCYRQPFVMEADGAAVRAFTDICMNKDTDIAKHPTDFSLHRIGDYEDTTGELTGEPPFTLAHATTIVAKSRQMIGNSEDIADSVADLDQEDKLRGVN